MSLLTIIQRHCQRNGLSVPSGVVASTDTTIIQLLALMNDLVELICDQDQFQGFTREKTFVLTAAENQGALTTLIGTDYLWLHNGTVFDRTLKRPVYGPLNDQEWQAIKALPNPGPWYKYRIWQNSFYVNPTPTASTLSTIALEYQSTFGVTSSGGSGKATFTADDDTFVLPERILNQGINFLWKQQKGLQYQAEEDRFWSMLNNAIAKDASKPTIRLDGETGWNLKPGIMVPTGNWNV